MAKIKLKAIEDGKDENRYCGPSVISALTDLTTGEAARLIRMQTGARKITGTSTSEVGRALRACNISMQSCYYPDLDRKTRPTLAGWLRMSKADRTPGRIFLIIAGRHWQLVSGRRYTCGRIREIVSIKDKRVKRRARVAKVYELTSDNVTRPDIDVSKPKDPNAGVRAKAQRIAKKIGAEIEVDNYGEGNHYWTGPPKGLFEEDGRTKDGREDPYEGGRCCHYWDAVLGIMLDYQDMIAGQKVSWDGNDNRPRTIT
jgi:hypothetical protein